MRKKILTPKQQIKQSLTEIFQAMAVDGATIKVNLPTQKGFGDLTTNVALENFQLVKTLALHFGSPREFAQWLTSKLKLRLINETDDSPFAQIKFAGPGFINFYFSEQFLWQRSLGLISQKAIRDHLKTQSTKKIMIEFTDPNPFKVLHVGHVYSNTVGETISRTFEALGHKVRRACYQGDVGLHVAKTLWGWWQLKQPIKVLQKQKLNERVAFLGKAYTYGATHYQDNQQAATEIKQLNYLVFVVAQDRLVEEMAWRPQVDYRQYLKKAELDKFDYNLIKEMYFFGRRWSLAAFELVYQQLGTKFSDYFFESEAAEFGLKIVKQFLVKGVFAESRGAVVFPGEKYGLHTRVFINALGLPTYEAKELGLAPMKYKKFAYDQSIIITANEIDEYFKVLLQAMKLTMPDLAQKTRHISHGVVRLTEGKMSSRTGKVIQAQQFLEQIYQLARSALGRRKGLSTSEKTSASRKVAIAAIKYALLKSNLSDDIVFDPQTSIAFNGDAGPYIQYSYVRSQCIWRQLNKRLHLDKGLVIDILLNNKVDKNKHFFADLKDEEIDLLRNLNQYFDIVNQVASQLRPHLLANYLFGLAQSFSQFYEKLPILIQVEKEKLPLEKNKRILALPLANQRRLLFVEMVAQTLKHGLWLLGIETVEKM